MIQGDPTAKSAKDAKNIAATLCVLCGDFTHEKP